MQRPPTGFPLLFVVLALPLLAGGQAPPPDPERVRWVTEHAVAVRSIDPADEDFADLMPLVRAIGKARVVQLGEATHGDGATFLAKGRLVRFLHQVMGFDVVAWETGIFDVRQMDTALRAGLPSGEAARRGIYPAWHNEESMWTLDYLRASQRTDRPIESVGFDCRIGLSPNRTVLYPQMIFDFFDRLDPVLLPPSERERFKAVSLAVNSLPNERHWKPEIKQYLELPRRLIETIDRRREELLVHYPPREIDFVRRTLVTLLNTERAIVPGGMQTSPTYRRDTAMGENLLWWLNGPLADRKVIVWAHNYHVMNDNYLAPGAAGDGHAVATWPMGRFLKTELGADLYTIGFTSHGGSYLDDDDRRVAVTPGPLETLLHAAGRSYLFLDFARVPLDHWLRDRWTASFYMYWPTESRWPRVYDGVFFIDAQKPATPLAAP
ncbi:MAG TPA: erythromycin esterase family protein [Thermoanaerobaculia bacterium]|nr:erythromycin esterase family protein [Thermoanaerobaculia bacterium]